MTQWIVVSRSRHAGKHYLPGRGYAYAAEQQAVPVLIAELAKLIPHYALGFVRQEGGDGGGYQPVALTGLGRGQNLYLNREGKWLAAYVPAFLRSHPFRLLPAENQQQVVCIHQDHLVEEDPRGQPLFDQEGNLSKPVQDTLNFLKECEKNRKVTAAACSALDKAGVIEKWPLQVKLEEGGEPVQVAGLYRVSEKAMYDLDAGTFAGLRSSGALLLAYGQLFSMNQLSRLIDRAKYLAGQQKSEPEEPEEPDIENLFGQDDILKFDDI